MSSAETSTGFGARAALFMLAPGASRGATISAHTESGQDGRSLPLRVEPVEAQEVVLDGQDRHAENPAVEA